MSFLSSPFTRTVSRCPRGFCAARHTARHAQRTGNSRTMRFWRSSVENHRAAHLSVPPVKPADRKLNNYDRKSQFNTRPASKVNIDKRQRGDEFCCAGHDSRLSRGGLYRRIISVGCVFDVRCRRFSASDRERRERRRRRHANSPSHGQLD